jgi:hypothetical protein
MQVNKYGNLELEPDPEPKLTVKSDPENLIK